MALPANAIVCASCGAKAREDRARCLRCGLVLAAAAPVRVGRPGVGRWRAAAAMLAGAVSLGGAAALTSRPADGTASAVAGHRVSGTAPDAASTAAPGQGGSTTVAPAPEFEAIDASRAALAAYGSGDLARSVAQFMEAVEANPESAAALNNLGQVLVRTGRPADAIPYFDRALEIAGDTWSFHFNRARAFGELGVWPRAIAGYRDAVRLFPEDYATHYNLGKALQANGDLPAAIEAFERAIELAPGQADFHLSHGLALEAALRQQEAAAAYRRFLELEPSSPDAETITARISHLEGL